MPKAKIILFGIAAGLLGVLAGLAFVAPWQMESRREVSEVTRLLSESEFIGLQIAWIVLGLLASTSALFLGWKAWRLIRSATVHP